MKKIFKFFVYLFLLIFFILLLLPKESLYNYLEHKLSSTNIIVSNEQRKERLLSLDVNNSDIYYEGIKVANIREVSFLTLLFYNEINMKNIEVLDSLAVIIPPSIKNVNIKYSILDYKNIHINSAGSFGKLEGTFNILNTKLTLNLDASKLMKTKYLKLLKSMKFKDGKYIWEKSL